MESRPKKPLDQVRDAKGAHDRYTLLPASPVEALRDHQAVKAAVQKAGIPKAASG